MNAVLVQLPGSGSGLTGFKKTGLCSIISEDIIWVQIQVIIIMDSKRFINPRSGSIKKTRLRSV